MGPARPVGSAFFPLDEELGLLSGGLTPRGEETLVRLSTWMPYESARELLEDLLGMRVSKATERRWRQGRQRLRYGMRRWSGSSRKLPRRLRERRNKR